MMLQRLLRLILVTLQLFHVSCSQDEPEISSPAGTFRGKVLTARNGLKFTSFRGIPYALPPVGDRRFARPVPITQIPEGVYDATEFGQMCLQNVLGSSLGQEDCLYLNVFTPLITQDVQEGKLKKVLVFIHGGGFILGTSQTYIPGDLVTRADVLVVTMNYRLGWLGVLRGNSSSLPGNQAFYDQIQALKWVKDNIQSFGGDPNDVTLSGESAGSLSVSLLSVSPLTKGLFTKVILLSGTAYMLSTPPWTSNDFLLDLASQVGCVEDKEEIMVSCLQRQPADKLIFELTISSLISLASSGDDFLPRPLSVLLRDPEYLSEIGFFNRDYIISLTKHDGYIQISSLLLQYDTSSVEKAVPYLTNLLLLPESVTESLLWEYTKIFDNVEQSVIGVATDFLYVKDSLNFLKIYEQGDSLSESNSYLLSFDHSPQYMPHQYMIHALDLTYLFDLIPEPFLRNFYKIENVGEFTDEDFKLKSAYIDLISAFIKTGNPNEYLTQENNIVWPSFHSRTQHYLSFSLQPSIKQDIFGKRRVIWEELLPQWIKLHNHQGKKQEL